MEKYRIMGAPCLLVESIDDAKEYLKDLIENKKGGYSVAINAEKIMLYSKRHDLKEVIDKSPLQVPDGAGAVLGMKYLHGKKCIKLHLPNTIYELANEEGYKLFILGSAEDVNKKAVNVLREKYSDINIVDRMNGYWDDISEVGKRIKKSDAQIVMVALGSPKQELFSAEYSEKFKDKLFIGCGGSLDTLSGKVKAVPDFFRYNNLEWLFRLLRSPGSLKRIKRQWILPVFLTKLIFTALKKKLF